METIERKLINVSDSVLINIGNGVVLPFTRVFQFPMTPESYLAHIKIWDNLAPFYFLFTENDKQREKIKGYEHSWFIPNLFREGYDKNNKMYLRCNIHNPKYELKYFPIKNINDVNLIDDLKENKHLIFDAYEESSMDTFHIHGEAIELIRL